MSAALAEAPPPLQETIAALVAGEQNAATRALYETLHRSIRGRVSYRVRARYSDLLSRADQEDLISEVECQLLLGALRTFRGTSRGELLGFARTITDRQIWRSVQRRLRERRLLEAECAEAVIDWSSRVAPPDQSLIAVPDSPLAPADTQYLLGLIQAGSQAAFAREQQVSRAAVTQRLHRIRGRISHMSAQDQETTQCWMQQILSLSHHQR